MSKLLSAAILAVLLALLAPSVCRAYTSVAPYNGVPQDAITALALDGLSTATSKVFDWTLYSGAQVTVSFTNSHIPSSCDVTVTLTTSSALNGTALSAPNQVATDTNAKRKVSYSSLTLAGKVQTYSVGSTSSYIRLSATGNHTVGLGTCTASITVAGVAFPVDTTAHGPVPEGTAVLGAGAAPLLPVVVGGLDIGTGAVDVHALRVGATGGLVVSSAVADRTFATPATSPLTIASGAGGTVALTTTAANPNFNLQNVGTQVIVCAFDTPTAAHFSIALKADSTGLPGLTADGGSYTEDHGIVGTVVTCLAQALTGSLAITLK